MKTAQELQAMREEQTLSPYAFRSAIRQAVEYASSDAISRITQGIATLKSQTLEA